MIIKWTGSNRAVYPCCSLPAHGLRRTSIIVPVIPSYPRYSLQQHTLISKSDRTVEAFLHPRMDIDTPPAITGKSKRSTHDDY